MPGNVKKYYAVARGYKPGIYTSWFGPNGAEIQIRGYRGARYKGFPSREQAESWLFDPSILFPETSVDTSDAVPETGTSPSDAIHMYTDGCSRGNPGPGGYGTIIDDGKERTELSQGYSLTTNNRMELMACIAGLKILKKPSTVILHSDSRYVVDGMTKGWARRWHSHNWMRTKTEAAENADLWSQLLDLCDHHRVEFIWVRGHAGHPENERCDQLATGAADSSNRVGDRPYIEGRTKFTSALLG